MILKNILGVHGKASNHAINAELGTFPACFKSFILMFKYYNRLKRIEFDNGSRNSLLRSAFIEDKKLNKSLNKTTLLNKNLNYHLWTSWTEISNIIYLLFLKEKR
jgi:hypothetical protein